MTWAAPAPSPSAAIGAIGVVRLTNHELADYDRSRLSRCELTPFRECSSAVLLEDIATVEVTVGHCQTNLSGPAKGAGLRRSGRQLTPLREGGRTVLFEGVAGVEVTAEVEVVVDRGMGGSKLLESLHAPELRHRSFSSSEWLV